MLSVRVISAMVAVSAIVLSQSAPSAETFPNRPIRIVTSAAGGGADVVARIIAQGISPTLGQQVVIDNRTGGAILGDIVSKAPADGYTLLLTGSFWILPLIQKVAFDPVKDFAPLTLATIEPNVLVVHPSVAAKSVKELIALAKAKPGELNYSSGPSGGTAHLAGELFKTMAGVNIVRIPYKGGGPALNALLAGEVQVTFSSASSVVPHAKSGRLRALAVGSSEPSALAPGLPTVAATGVPGYESVSINGMFVPAGTPAPVIKRLNEEIVRVLHQPDIKERLLASGTEGVGSSPEQFAQALKGDLARMSKVIREANIRAD